MKSSRPPGKPPARPVPPANPLVESWHQARLAWIALALLVAVALGRALTTGFVADDFGILDAVNRGGFGRLLAGNIPGTEPVSLVRDLGFWWWGSVMGLRATGFHVVALMLALIAIVSLAAAATRLGGVRAGLVAAAIVVLAPHAPVLVGWVPALPDALALLGATAALALVLHRRAWPAAIATFLAIAARETLVALPLALAAAAALAPAADAPAESEPRSRGAARLLARVGPSVLAAALAIGARIALDAWPREAAAPPLAGRLILPPGAAAGLVASVRALPLLAVALLVGAALVVHGRGGMARTTERSGRGALVGWTLAVAALIPLLITRRPWADVESMTVWAGLALALAVALDRLHPWFTRAFLMALAVVQLAAQHAAPVPDPARRARPVVTLALLESQSRPVSVLAATIATMCEPLRKTPKGFLAGVPPDAMLGVLLGPVARVTCRDTTIDLRLLGDFRASDAWHAFIVVHGDPGTGQVVAEPADALVRARIGEGYLVHARPDVAAACFEAALSERPDDPELAFPLALALTASGRDSAARASWARARARGAAPATDTLAARFLYGTPDDRVAAARPPVTAAVTALARDPSDSTAARALGRALTVAGATRSAAIAWAVAWGRTGANSDLVEYAGALEALEQPDLARQAYQRALATGLPRPLYDRARQRLAALGGPQSETP